MNFIGSKRVVTWNERSAFSKKWNALSVRLRLPMDTSIEPFKTLLEIKDVRDHLAHGKPREINLDIATSGTLWTAAQTPADSLFSARYAQHACAQVLAFEALLMKAARIRPDQAETKVSSFTVAALEAGITVRKTRSVISPRRARPPLVKPKAGRPVNREDLLKALGSLFDKPPPRGPRPKRDWQ